MGTGQGSSREAISGRDMRVALHELSHVSFGAHHDKCLDPQSGIMMEYGNPFSVMGRAWSQNAVSQVPGSRRVDLGYQTTDFHPDNFAIQGLSQLFAGQLYPSTRIVDVAQDGEEVTVGAFDVLPTLLDDSVTLAARVSLDVADPEFYVMVSVRALADEATAWPNRELHPSHAHLQPNELPPAGHVEVTMHSRYLRRGKSIGFSETAQLLDTTPGSTFLNLTQSHPEVAGSNAACIDGAMYPGSQFWFDPLDLLIEVRSVVPIAQPFPRDSAAMFPGRSEWMYSIAEQPTATVGFYRISSLEERRAADCGNGVRDATEQCDGGTGCANCFCDKEAGFAPVFGSTTALGCVQSCGDGEVRGREECDPADETVTAEERARCGTDCTCKEGFGTEWVGANFHPGYKHNTCKPGSSKPKALATCGDGEVSALDECDGSEYCNERCECTTRPKFVFNPALLDEKAAKGALSGSALYSPLTLDGCVDWLSTTGSDLSWSSRLVLPEYTSGVFREAVDGEGESGLSTTTIIGLVAGALVCLAACTTIAAIAVAAVVRARRPVRSATPTLVQGSRRRSVRASRPQSGRVRAGSIAWH
uniref:Uncharacterized protein n=1 Tax=Sexangularia sp. CB-2014 TaxID=1486929 RepID=A0A7S1V5D8_9EUKA|mmetsp:Transcript_11837/g.37592  ORF Transcript_11837/g.37592 Transcript_11837/m.37592 type:complete len:589 (+) Transcript_11837:2-1768(+)